MARIKKIMQKDEDVGKIALATPILISKSLEMFLSELLSKTCNITKDKTAKVVTLTHLKQCILGEPNFDFLKDIVQNVPDVEPERSEKRGRPRKDLSASGGLRGSRGGSDDEDEEDDEEEEEDEEDDEDEEEDEDSDDEDTASSAKKKQSKKRKVAAAPPPPKPKKERKPRAKETKPRKNSKNALAASSSGQGQFMSSFTVTPPAPTTPTHHSTTPAAAHPLSSGSPFPTSPYSASPPHPHHPHSPFAPNMPYMPALQQSPLFVQQMQQQMAQFHQQTNPMFTSSPPPHSLHAQPQGHVQAPPVPTTFTFSAPPKRVQDDYENEDEEDNVSMGVVGSAPPPHALPSPRPHTTTPPALSPSLRREHVDTITHNFSGSSLRTSSGGLNHAPHSQPPPLSPYLPMQPAALGHPHPHPHPGMLPTPPSKPHHMASLLRSSRDTEDYDFSDAFVVHPHTTPTKDA